MRAHFTPQAEIDLEEVGDYIALDTSTLPASIAFYRPQATFFDGRPDGKIGTPRH
jgi:hypothetical protein